MVKKINIHPFHTKLILVAFLIGIIFSVTAQIGGGSTYQFLELSNSARMTATGGVPIPVKDNDLSLSLANPSLLTKEMNNQISLSYVDYFTDINYGFASYAKNIETLGIFNTSVQYVNYGTFKEADESGVVKGNFSANDIASTIGWSRNLFPSLSLGANLKGIYSHLQNYSSYGIAADLAMTYYDEKRQFVATMLARNMGRQIKYYHIGVREPLPFNIQLGVSKKMAHVPLRLNLVYEHLEKYDITYPEMAIVITDPVSGAKPPEKKFQKFADNLGRHFVASAEFVPSKNLNIYLGFNYRRRQELQVDTKRGIAGLSAGFACRIYKFYLGYGIAKYNTVRPTNYITISTNISNFLTKENKDIKETKIN